MKINLGIHCPNPKDVTSLYRGVGPLAELRKNKLDLEIDCNMFSEMSWVTCKISDVIFMQRPYNDQHLTMAQLAKKNNKPLWIDYDDFLMDLPVDNPAYDVYMTERVHSNIVKILSLADIVTVTTRGLKALYEQQLPVAGNQLLQMAKNVIVIPNSYDQYFHGMPVTAGKNKLITWRGSDTHDRDLAIYADPIIQFMKENPDWKIQFIGYNPWRITEAIGEAQCTYVKQLDPFYYMDYLKKQNPSLHIVPLSDSVFNRCKSNISWIESTVAGAVCIAPDWEEWQKPGVVTYRTKEDFYLALTSGSKNLDKLDDFRKASINYIIDNYSMDDSNMKRATIVSKLVTGRAFDILKVPKEDYVKIFNYESEGEMNLE